MKERPDISAATQEKSQRQYSRRTFIKIGGAAGFAAAATYVAIESREQKREEPKSYRHTTSQEDAEKGLEAVIAHYFSDFSEEQIQAYIHSDLFRNLTAEANKRNLPTRIEEGDILVLTEPTRPIN